jgi:hypothetical protein
VAEIYIPNDQYNAAVNTIAEKTGVDPDEIKIALGEEANIWPESMADQSPVALNRTNSRPDGKTSYSNPKKGRLVGMPRNPKP